MLADTPGRAAFVDDHALKGSLIARDYGLGDTYLGMIPPFAINCTGVLIFRQYFVQLPSELFDAGRIDGAGELRTL